MGGNRSVELARREIVCLSHAGLDSKTFRVETVKQLRRAIPVDASFFATADPATLLFTDAVVDDVLADAAGQFLENEFLRDDSLKFVDLARGRSPVDSLGAATAGELVRSTRYQEILEPLDLGQLHITPNTVRDHFKSIFDKVGVRSRRVLVGQIFAQQYGPRMAARLAPDPDGWFA